MILTINLRSVQHLVSASLEIDLSKNALMCIVGKNGVGKTTLIKALKNIVASDTFKKTSSDRIFDKNSSIEYIIDGSVFNFTFDSQINSIDSKNPIPDDLKDLFEVELPMPFGERFNFFQKISEADGDIRKSIALETYHKPERLIAFMKDVYRDSKFDSLIEINTKKEKYYCLLQADSFYIREDYFSSGEYFLINLFRNIEKSKKLIVVDEIDISLDAAAQVHLVNNLEKFCTEFGVNIVFTSHSLAIMKTMRSENLYYMDNMDNHVSISLQSYNYIKSILFGFTDWDKYILTEDDVLKDFILHVIKKHCGSIFFKFIVIYAGGGSNIVALMQRNSRELFFSDEENVICVLDGDQRMQRHAKKKGVYCIPVDSVEKELHRIYHKDQVLPRVPPKEEANGKYIKKYYEKNRIMSQSDIFDLVCRENVTGIRQFKETLEGFLNK